MLQGDELPMALRAAYMALHRSTDNALARHGITADQFVLLATVARAGELTQREIARRMPSDPSTVRAMLVLLENQQLVERTPHPQDSRALLVRLTPTGRRKFRQLWKAGDSIRQRMMDSMSRKDLDKFVENLRQLAVSLGINDSPAIEPPVSPQR